MITFSFQWLQYKNHHVSIFLFFRLWSQFKSLIGTCITKEMGGKRRIASFNPLAVQVHAHTHTSTTQWITVFQCFTIVTRYVHKGWLLRECSCWSWDCMGREGRGKVNRGPQDMPSPQHLFMLQLSSNSTNNLGNPGISTRRTPTATPETGTNDCLQRGSKARGPFQVHFLVHLIPTQTSNLSREP